MSAKNGFLQTLPILTTPNYEDLSNRPAKTAPTTTTRTSRRTTQATTLVTEPAVEEPTKLPVNFKNTKDSLVYKTIQKMYPKITIEPSELTVTSTTAAPAPIYTPSDVSNKLTTTVLRETKTLTQKMVPTRTTRKTIPTTTKLLLRTKTTKLLTRTTKPSSKPTTRPTTTTTTTTRTTTHGKKTRRRKKTRPTTTTTTEQTTIFKFSINEINKNLAKHLGYLNLTDEKLTNYSKYVNTMTSTRDSPVKSQKIDLFESDQISNRSTKPKKLSRTELTIIVSCVTFVTLLTLINLLIYAFRK